MTCRDRNRLALESDLLGAGALGLENILVISGDFVSLGDHPDAKPVYDADSVQFLQIARGLMAGHDSADQPLQGNPQFCLGAVLIPEADPLGPQLLKVRKKLAAGARFFHHRPYLRSQEAQPLPAATGSTRTSRSWPASRSPRPRKWNRPARASSARSIPCRRTSSRN